MRTILHGDFMVDELQRPLILEVNTIPGFTSHSLVPKAALRAGIAWTELVDRLARLASATVKVEQATLESADAAVLQTVGLSA